MNILAAIKREERKLEKQLGKLPHQSDGVRAAAKALGHSAGRELTSVKKTSIVVCRESKDVENRQEAMGQNEGAGEEGRFRVRAALHP